MKWNIKEKYNTMVSDTDSAMKCFALSESKSPEWAKKMIKVWYNVAIGIWLAIASVTFAPISFIFRIVCSFVKHINNHIIDKCLHRSFSAVKSVAVPQKSK